MIFLQAATMIIVGVLGLGVVLVADPLRQVIAIGVFGIALIILFTVLQAPDVVLSAIVVGVLAYPVMILLALAKLRRRQETR
jgi:uncharacterized MnhB-related membrane protein